MSVPGGEVRLKGAMVVVVVLVARDIVVRLASVNSV
jgi:hypothetical protein